MTSKGIVYYTDNQLDDSILIPCQRQLIKASAMYDSRIVSVSLEPMDFGENIVLDLERGVLTMFKQILAGLEAIDTDIVFFAEHDVLYHPSHFDFVRAERPDKLYYYNLNVWKVRVSDGHALRVDLCRMTSGLCARRDLLLQHYRERVRLIEEHGGHALTRKDKYVRRMGFEPGTHGRAEKVDSYRCGYWESEYPNLDLVHDQNFTWRRWEKEKWRNKRWIRGWTESEEVPGWGRVKGRMEELLDTI
jgi:hypothetical protein